MLREMFMPSFLNLLYPPACLLCDRRLEAPEPCVCETCRRAMPRLLPPVCRRCGVSLPGAYDASLVCRSCMAQPPAFEQARAPFLYIGLVRDALHAFKYHGHRRVGAWLAEAMVHLHPAAHAEPPYDLLASVPMHWVKGRLKGMNPAAWLAQALSRQMRIAHEPRALRRMRWTSTQTRLSRTQRARNVAGAFRATPALVTRCRVLLIDDVLTTGATAHACALALREAGASAVSVLAAAIAPAP